MHVSWYRWLQSAENDIWDVNFSQIMSNNQSKFCFTTIHSMLNQPNYITDNGKIIDPNSIEIHCMKGEIVCPPVFTVIEPTNEPTIALTKNQHTDKPDRRYESTIEPTNSFGELFLFLFFFVFLFCVGSMQSLNLLFVFFLFFVPKYGAKSSVFFYCALLLVLFLHDYTCVCVFFF